MGKQDDYDAAKNSHGCYALALREIRLEKIRSGLFQPRVDDPEEMDAARVAPSLPPMAGFPAANARSA
jgi:hypothetical protein